MAGLVVQKLEEPIWFDTGKKMADGKTPRTVAAYDTKELAEYKDKKTWLGTFDPDGAEEFILWKRIGTAEAKTVAPPPNKGITGTENIRKRK